MTTEIVISPILDKHMNSNINESPIWKSAFHENEITEDIRRKHKALYEYHIKFDGVKPIQMTKMIEL